MKVNLTVKIKKLHANALPPEYKTSHSAGADLYACLGNDVVIHPMEIVMVPTGFSMELPEGHEAQVRPRSGLAVKGITVPNSPGTIDADYRGEVKVILMNLGKENFTVRHHDRVAQMIIAKVDRCEFRVEEELTETQRGSGGFGSTGVGK